MNNEQTASPKIISDFKNDVAKQISDVYTDLSQHNKSTKYVKDFQEKFGTHGEETERTLTPGSTSTVSG